jgi:DNA invertase Pin-like site-specific DNA recombinase
MEDRSMSTKYVDEMAVQKLTEAGFSARLIAKELDCDKRTVHRIRVRLGIAKPSRRLMTAEELEIAERLLADGAPVIEIERTLGRSVGALNRRYKGQGWSKQEVCEFAGACSRAARRMRNEGSWGNGS